MFASLKRFKQLPDYMQIWPAHGAGSACGKALGAIPSSTVGYEKLFNWALGYEDEDAFVKALLSGQPEPPKYFAMMKKLNKVARPVFKKGLPQPSRLELPQLQAALAQGATVIDTRSPNEFAAGHIPGTINIPEDNAFTNWAGWMLSYEQPFYLIASESTARQAVHDLVYIGLDKLGGYFEPGIIKVWPNVLQSYQVTTPKEVAGRITRGEVTVVDVRALSEWEEGHIPGATHIMLGYLAERAAELPTGKPVVVHCRTSNRSAIAASILQARGVPQVIKMQEGYVGWVAAGFPVERNGKQKDE
jgi:hydroxyacylglutathione hydrolase